MSIFSEGMLNNARDASVMDTLPLNGNHGNTYSDYLTYGSSSPTTLEKKILKELTANYASTYHPSTKLANHVANGGVPSPASTAGINRDDENAAAVALGISREDENNAHTALSLEIIREESQAPLLPPRPLPPDGHPPLHTFSTHRRLPQENNESFFPLLKNETHSSHVLRDSLYTSMPTLTDHPHGTNDINGIRDEDEDDDEDEEEDEEEDEDEEEEEGSELHLANGKGVIADADDVYYKSMPNLGSRNHIQELQSYYHMGRGGSDGFIAPPEKDESSPEEQPQDPSQLVTSL